MPETRPLISVRDMSKSFTLHNQGAVSIEVLSGVNLDVDPGECVALTGPSGSGKSTLMRVLYGNHRAQSGQVLVASVDLATASPREVLKLRRETLGHVSQFLRVVPRVLALDVVAQPLPALGIASDVAKARASVLLSQLNIPRQLWSLSPTTFSGGEQQRINIACGFAHDYPMLLLNEPTASLDPGNREVVLSLIEGARKRGAALVGIFHDAAARDRVCNRQIDVAQFSRGAAA